MSNWKQNALAATRGTQLGAIIACALGETIDAPCFHGKGTVTSDGFIIADFTGSDGRDHMGAFVGSVSDLARNVTGLAKHLNLDAADNAELLAVVRDWIGQDYSNTARTLLKAVQS